MKYVFVIGIARSGTTLLARLMALSPTPMRFFREPFYGLMSQLAPDRIDTAFISPNEGGRVKTARQAIMALASDDVPLLPEKNFKFARNDAGFRVVLIKEVHALLAFPEILKSLDCRVAVITRDTDRILDSYLVRYKAGNKRYLVEDYRYISEYLKRGDNSSNTLLEMALSSVTPRVKAYLKRPNWLTSLPIRTAATMEVLGQFLRAWVEMDDRVIHVPFEELCMEPVTMAGKVFEWFDLEHTDRTQEDIKAMTTGSSTEYYAQEKNSRQVLEQPYRMLSETHLRTISRLVARQ